MIKTFKTLIKNKQTNCELTEKLLGSFFKHYSICIVWAYDAPSPGPMMLLHLGSPLKTSLISPGNMI